MEKAEHSSDIYSYLLYYIDANKADLLHIKADISHLNSLKQFSGFHPLSCPIFSEENWVEYTGKSFLPILTYKEQLSQYFRVSKIDRANWSVPLRDISDGESGCDADILSGHPWPNPAIVFFDNTCKTGMMCGTAKNRISQ